MSVSREVWYKGVRRSLADLAREHDMTTKELYQRVVRYRWPIEKALSLPSMHKPVQVEFRGAMRSLSDLGREFGVSRDLLYNRVVRDGWPIAKALSIRRGAMGRGGARLSELGKMAKKAGMPYNTLWSRLHRGWSLERALSTPVKKMNVYPYLKKLKKAA